MTASDGVLNGRVAVVTGASRGIGRAAALELARAGASVMAVARRQPALEDLKQASSGIVPCPTDVADPQSVQDLFSGIRRDHGTVTILVAAAGFGRFGDSLQVDAADWKQHVDTNLSGVFFTNIAAIRHMVEAGAGDIVNVLSVSSKLAAAGQAAYAASKAGALALTRALQAEFRSRGVRITALLPGATATGIWDELGIDLDRTRMMKPEDVARAILWAVLQPPSSAVDELDLMPREGFL